MGSGAKVEQVNHKVKHVSSKRKRKWHFYECFSENPECPGHRPECPSTKSGVSELSGLLFGCPDGCSGVFRLSLRTVVRSIRTYTRSLRVLFRQRLRLAKQNAKLVHILHINIDPITTKDYIKMRSKLTKLHYMKIPFSRSIVIWDQSMQKFI